MYNLNTIDGPRQWTSLQNGAIDEVKSQKISSSRRWIQQDATSMPKIAPTPASSFQQRHNVDHSIEKRIVPQKHAIVSSNEVKHVKHKVICGIPCMYLDPRSKQKFGGKDLPHT